jgi:hypothetical protein
MPTFEATGEREQYTKRLRFLADWLHGRAVEFACHGQYGDSQACTELAVEAESLARANEGE